MSASTPSPGAAPESPIRRVRLEDGSAELVYQAFPGDRSVFVFLPGRPVLLVAEVTRIGSVSGTMLALPDAALARFDPYAAQIQAAAEKLYAEVTPGRSASLLVQPNRRF